MQIILLVYVFCKKIVFPATNKEAAVVVQNN